MKGYVVTVSAAALGSRRAGPPTGTATADATGWTQATVKS